MTAYFVRETINQLFYPKDLLVGYSIIGVVIGSLFTIPIIDLSDDDGIIGITKNYGCHLILNISVIGANGLYTFLLIKRNNVEVVIRSEDQYPGEPRKLVLK